MRRKSKRIRAKTAQPRPGRSAMRRVVVPRTEKQFRALSDDAQELWTRVTHVVSKMRSDRVSLTKASQEFGIERQAVLRMAKSALRKQGNGRYTVKSRDSLLRVLVIPTRDGLREVAVRDSEQASLVGRYWVAVQRYLQTGDESALQEFKGKRIKGANGKPVRLLTDTRDLDKLGNAGVLSFESLYARAS
jgi:hypothetical protein